MDDKQILDLITNKKTRDKGFSMLVDLTKNQVYWQLRKMVLSHDDANDLMQETYIKVFKNIHLFKQDSSLSTWIFRIATNECINFLKSKNKQKELLNTDIEKAYNLSSKDINGIDVNKTFQFLDQAINTLPDKQRKVFCMRYYENKSFKEISQEFNTSEGALKTSYHIAETKIRQILIDKQSKQLSTL